jgi:hypothetical protein
MLVSVIYWLNLVLPLLRHFNPAEPVVEKLCLSPHVVKSVIG